MTDRSNNIFRRLGGEASVALIIFIVTVVYQQIVHDIKIGQALSHLITMETKLAQAIEKLDDNLDNHNSRISRMEGLVYGEHSFDHDK